MLMKLFRNMDQMIHAVLKLIWKPKFVLFPKCVHSNTRNLKNVGRKIIYLPSASQESNLFYNVHFERFINPHMISLQVIWRSLKIFDHYSFNKMKKFKLFGLLLLVKRTELVLFQKKNNFCGPNWNWIVFWTVLFKILKTTIIWKV